MNNKHEQLLNFILKRVQDGKVDEAKKLIQAAGEKCVTGTFSNSDIGEFVPKLTMLIKPNHVDEVKEAVHEFAATFKNNQQ